MLSPHATISRPHRPQDPADSLRLTVWLRNRQQLLPEGDKPTPDRGSFDAVKVAVEKAGIADPADVHYVQPEHAAARRPPQSIVAEVRTGDASLSPQPSESIDLSDGCTGPGSGGHPGGEIEIRARAPT